MTEQADLDVTLYICILDVLGSNLGRSTGYSERISRYFPQSLQTNAGIVTRLGHDRFLPNPFQFIIHLSPSHPTLNTIDTEKTSLNYPQK
jgi:hypothetical protein